MLTDDLNIKEQYTEQDCIDNLDVELDPGDFIEILTDVKEIINRK